MDSIMSNDNDLKGRFDLDSYVSRYEGHTKLVRLKFIAVHASSLEKACYEALINVLKKGTNMRLYEEITTKYLNVCKKHTELDRDGDNMDDTAVESCSSIKEEYAYDYKFVEMVNRVASQKQERLEQELNSYKSNLIKESIRMAYNELGLFFYERGDLSEALKCYVRARDYCTTNRHMIDMCLNVIKISIHLGNYMHVTNYVTKAEQIVNIDTPDPVTSSELSCFQGLAYLRNKQYSQAAERFLQCHIDLGNTLKDVIHPEDVAVYGGFCALATFNRNELKDKVIDNAAFKSFLELVPPVREAILDFHSSNYGSCFRYLENLKAGLNLDIHLREHVAKLYQCIRRGALIQYFSPFLSVDMNSMAAAFNTTVSELEDEVSKLITEGEMSARIDSSSKVLYARQNDQRSATFTKAFDMGRKYLTDTRKLLLRTNLLKNNLFVHGSYSVVPPSSARGSLEYRGQSFKKHGGSSKPRSQRE